jgi:simple sugar transport system ATP-binding protein
MNPEHAPLIEMKNIEKHFGSVIALAGVSLDDLSGRMPLPARRQRRGQIHLHQDHVRRAQAHHRGDPGSKASLCSSTIRAMPSRPGIATVYQDLAMIPLMSVSRNFFMGNEPEKRFGPFKLFDHAYANG